MKSEWKVSDYTKTIVAIVATLALAIQSAISDGILTNTEIVNIGLSILGTLGVYVLPNTSPLLRAPTTSANTNRTK